MLHINQNVTWINNDTEYNGIIIELKSIFAIVNCNKKNMKIPYKILKKKQKEDNIFEDEEPKTPRKQIININNINKLSITSIKWKNMEKLINYSKQFIGLTLGEACNLAKQMNPLLPDIDDFIKTKKIKDKGLQGKLFETLLFGIPNNSDRATDFTGLIESDECPPDLKVTCIEEYPSKPGYFKSKERLTCTNISREELANCDSFEKSCYKNKCSYILLFVIEFKKYKTIEELLNRKIVRVIHINNIYEKYKKYIDEDYNKIYNMAKDSNLELSQAGQKYLHLPSHGSGHGSKTRALALTPKFLTEIIGNNIPNDSDNKGFLIKDKNKVMLRKFW
tara:strand:+ start:163 stop:1167 length:1005 start_codon:yes stop_codon:yes gene_type:complete